MSIQIIRDGNEALIAEATKYVERLGIPRKDVYSLRVGGEVGGAMIIEMQIFVRNPEGADGSAVGEDIERTETRTS